MSELMRAAAIREFGPADVLRVHELPRPIVGADEVLVRVVSAGVQLTDTSIRSGWTPPGATIVFPQVLGNEFAGIIEAVGSSVTEHSVGDAVLGFKTLNCYAEYVVAPQSQIVTKPARMTWPVAGTLSASGQTAHTAIEALSPSPGETVLVHGAAGGVGTMFTQLAVLAGATVIGTASPVNHDYLRELGAIPVAYGPGQLDRIRQVADRVDVAFDAAGHENLRTAVELVADRSRIATIVDMSLAADVGCRMLRSQRSADRLRELTRLVAAGDLQVPIRRTYPLEAAADAHRDVESGHGRGKVVLSIGSEA